MKAGEEVEKNMDNKLQGDRYLCLGGWRPYINLDEIELLVSPDKKKEIDMDDKIDQSDIVSLEDYVSAEFLKREAIQMSSSPVKISECDEEASPGRK